MSRKADLWSVRVAAWLTLAAIVIITLGPLPLRPKLTQDPQLERSLAFALLGALFSLGYPQRRVGAVILITGGALALEALQRFAPGRHGELADALAKAAGAVAGVAGVDLCQRLAPPR